jgi:hypothetical protein
VLKGVDCNLHFSVPSMKRLNKTEPVIFSICRFWRSLGILIFFILLQYVLRLKWLNILKFRWLSSIHWSKSLPIKKRITDSLWSTFKIQFYLVPSIVVSFRAQSNITSLIINCTDIKLTVWSFHNNVVKGGIWGEKKIK